MRIVRNLFFILFTAAAISAVGFTFWLRDRYVVPILMYHHIGPPSGTKWRLNSVSEKSFDYQINFLRRHGFRVITYDDLIMGIKGGQQFQRNIVVITFDDGYEDNYTHAFPILKKYDVPATMFLVSEWVGRPGFLTWAQIKEMERDNITFGAHTRHHAYLPALESAEAQDEITGSKKTIEANLGHPIDHFCYPAGGFSEETKRLVRYAGFKSAATTHRGSDRINVDLYELKRIHINNTDNGYSGLILWFKLSGYYNLFRHFKPGCGVHGNRVLND